MGYLNYVKGDLIELCIYSLTGDCRAFPRLANNDCQEAVPSIISFSIIAYLYNTSSIFYSGTKYDQSFIMNSVSWCLSTILSLSMLLASFIGNPDYHYYERLD
ncbi:hypothetical protein HPULCUR_011074 [Helicostylum pulchrum]|uniref:Uncharacterized protein n=1 Tax=Helicostylum pulchrum TaxID=562976 RepID=A0ABP9YFH1_9FUNG